MTRVINSSINTNTNNTNKQKRTFGSCRLHGYYYVPHSVISVFITSIRYL